MPIKPDEYTAMVNEVIDFKLQAVKEYIAEKIGPIGDIGSPEKFIGKKAEDWNPLEMQILSNVYGANIILDIRNKARLKAIQAMESLNGGV